MYSRPYIGILATPLYLTIHGYQYRIYAFVVLRGVISGCINPNELPCIDDNKPDYIEKSFLTYSQVLINYGAKSIRTEFNQDLKCGFGSILNSDVQRI